MAVDFRGVSFQPDAFSAAPLGFWEASQKDRIADVIQLIAIETGARAARELWQQNQLKALVAFAAQRSAIWSQRLANSAKGALHLEKIPLLTRADLRAQFEREGCLLRPGDKMGWREHQTSGSSGLPVRFYVAGANSQYNALRSIAQYFIEGRDFSLNRTQLFSSSTEVPNGFQTRSQDSWVGDLSKSIKSGGARFITYGNPNLRLLKKELAKEKIGYMIANPFLIESLLQVADVAFLQDAGLKIWIPIGAAPDRELSRAFTEKGVGVRATYSSEECGAIGYECPTNPGRYHVASSNVLVECLFDEPVRLNGEKLGRLVVTKLHSYATPLIRYDIGDLGVLEKKCPCGHDGPTLSQVVGRTKNLLRRRDGSVSPFLVQVKNHRWLADYKEYRIRQTALDEITVEIGGKTNVDKSDKQNFEALVKLLAGDEFRVVIQAFDRLDWGADTKRLSFSSPFV